MKFSKKRLVSVLVAVALIAGVTVLCTTLAFASSQDQAMISADEARTFVQEAYPDYTIGEIEFEKDKVAPVYDVEATDKEGIPYDIEVDPNDGTILKIQIDDDYAATGVVVQENGEDEDDDEHEDENQDDDD